MFTFYVTFSLNIIAYILLLLIGNQTYVFIIILYYNYIVFAVITINFIIKLYFSVLSFKNLLREY